MSIGINVGAFRDAIMPGIHRQIVELDRLMRTKQGRKKLSAEFRQRAKGLREFAARGDFRSHCPWPTAEPYLKMAADLEAEARRYERMRGSKGLWE